MSADSEKKLAATSSQSIEKDGILATRLCSHTQDADLINESQLKALPGEVKVFEALDSNPAMGKMLDNQTTVPRKLELKIGAQVSTCVEFISDFERNMNSFLIFQFSGDASEEHKHIKGFS